MARGGYRVGAGRKPGSKGKAKGTPPKKQTETSDKKKIKAILDLGVKAKARMYQEFLLRISKGESLSITEKKLMDKIGAELTEGLSDDDKEIIEAENLDPLEYMLKVMNDPLAEKDRRDKMAIAAAPFIHARKGEGAGKKQEREERAKAAGGGKFASGKPPLRMVK